jgi:hypothetical protein
VGLLRSRDPLSENVRLGKLGVAGVGLMGVAKGLVSRIVSGSSAQAPATIN